MKTNRPDNLSHAMLYFKNDAMRTPWQYFLWWSHELLHACDMKNVNKFSRNYFFFQVDYLIIAYANPSLGPIMCNMVPCWIELMS